MLCNRSFSGAKMGGGFVKLVDWSNQQLEALDRIIDWYKHSKKLVFKLTGYAGTGKTTLLPEVARRIGGQVEFAAFTGRAAANMKRRGCGGAVTIDSLIYTRSRFLVCGDKPPCDKVCKQLCPHHRERYVDKTLNAESALADADLGTFDEASMIGETMGRDLVSFVVPLVVVMDDWQLP